MSGESGAVVRRIYTDIVMRDRSSSGFVSAGRAADDYQKKMNYVSQSVQSVQSAYESATAALERCRAATYAASSAQREASIELDKAKVALTQITQKYINATTELRNNKNATDADRAAVASLKNEVNNKAAALKSAELALKQSNIALKENKLAEDNAAEATRVAGKNLERQNTEIEEAKKRSDTYRNSLLAVGAALTAVGVAGSVYFSTAAQNYGKYATSLTAYNNMMGESADANLERLQTATNGAISNADLVLIANKAMAMGISQDALPRLAEIATAAGKVLGQDTSQMFDNIVTGIARGSPLILDNLGIIVSVGEANEEYAKSLGKSANALSEAEQQQAMLNAVIESGQTLIDKAGTSASSTSSSYAQMQAAMENMNLAMGQAVSGPMTSWYNLLAGVANMVSALPTPLVNVVGLLGITVTSVASVTGPLMLQAAALIFLRSQWVGLKAQLITTPAYAAAAAAGLSPLIAGLYATAAAAWAALGPLAPFLAIAGAIAGVAAIDYGIRGNESVVGSLFGSTSAIASSASPTTNNNVTINQTNNMSDNTQITTTASADEIEAAMNRLKTKWAGDTSSKLKQEIQAILQR